MYIVILHLIAFDFTVCLLYFLELIIITDLFTLNLKTPLSWNWLNYEYE